MQTTLIRRLFCAMLCCTMLPSLGDVVSAADKQGICEITTVFPNNTPTSWFRIPTMITTKSGAVWCFANDRRDSIADNTPIQWLVASHAEDGIHFTEYEYLLRKEGWSFVIGTAAYDAVNDNIMVIYNAQIRTTEAQNAYNALSENEKEPLGLCFLESADGGKTWTKRKASFPACFAYPNKVPTTHGSGAGIQLTKGEHAGRIVLPCRVYAGGKETPESQTASHWSCLMYSDDFGKTWKVSNLMKNGNETAVTELPDGTLYINSRDMMGDGGRLIGYSYDGGATISDIQKEYQVAQHAYIGCKGSLTTFENPKQPGEFLTLFVCTNSPQAQNYSMGLRKNLCIWISYDEGKTWPSCVQIDSGSSGYSEIDYNPQTQRITLLYEYSKKTWDGCKVLSFDVDWLTANAKDNVPLFDHTLSEAVVPAIPSEGKVVHLTPEGLASYADGAEVSLWADASGSDNDAKAYKSYDLPTVTHNALNGQSVLTFSDKANAVLAIPDTDDFAGDVTWFIVYQSKSIGNESQYLLQNRNSYMMSSGISSKYKTVFSSVSRTQTDINAMPAYNDKFHILCLTWNGTDKGYLAQMVDGSTNVMYDGGTHLLRDRELSSEDTTIGLNLHGAIAEIIIYNRALSNDEIAGVGLSLAETYGLKWNGVKAREADPNDSASDTNEAVTGDNGQDKANSSILGILLGIVGGVAAAVAAVVLAVKKRKPRSHHT